MKLRQNLAAHFLAHPEVLLVAACTTSQRATLL